MHWNTSAVWTNGLRKHCRKIALLAALILPSPVCNAIAPATPDAVVPVAHRIGIVLTWGIAIMLWAYLFATRKYKRRK